MFRSKPNNAFTTSSSPQCKKHPKHKQSPGVCSLCLSQRLAKISYVGTRDVAVCRRVYSEGSSCASSDLSSDVSSDVSSCVSPREIMEKKTEKSRFWSRLLIGRRRTSTSNGYFHGKMILSHSEPLPMTTASIKVLAS